jgi:hypothetical protein
MIKIYKAMTALLAANLMSVALVAQNNLRDDGKPFTPSTVNLSHVPLQKTSSNCDSITGFLAPTNGFSGNVFNVVALQPLTITGIAADLYQTGTDYYYVYKRTGSCIGYNNTASGWIKVDSAQVTKTTTNDTVIQIPMTFSITMNAGDTVGLYVGLRSNTPLGHHYQTGVTLNAVFHQDANIQMLEGYGSSTFFTANNYPRDFGGYLNYCLAAPSGITVNNDAAALKMYPNPASTEITVRTEANGFTADVYNLLGRLVYSEKAELNTKKLDLSSLASGSYLIKVTSLNGEIFTKQLIISK